MEASGGRRFTEVDLQRVLEQIVERDPAFRVIGTETRVGSSRARADMMLESDGVITVVEVKSVVPQTATRFEETLEQLRGYRKAIARQFPRNQVQLVLAIPGVLTPDKGEALAENGIELWDREWIIAHATAVGLGDDIHRIFGDTHTEPHQRSQAEELQWRLDSLVCGRAQWYDYQKLCGDILEYLFCPPLKTPIPESSNVPRINRRDFIVPNYVSDGFWHFMRLHYRADYLVVDAKNNCGQANKTHVLQIANYLSSFGTGLFGIIITRKGMDRAGMYTCREQWMLHGKMIITLNDGDLLQMLESKKIGADPEDLVRQKIEDFRLGM
jgi:hypothetical protein